MYMRWNSFKQSKSSALTTHDEGLWLVDASCTGNLTLSRRCHSFPLLWCFSHPKPRLWCSRWSLAGSIWKEYILQTFFFWSWAKFPAQCQRILRSLTFWPSGVWCWKEGLVVPSSWEKRPPTSEVFPKPSKNQKKAEIIWWVVETTIFSYIS